MLWARAFQEGRKSWQYIGDRAMHLFRFIAKYDLKLQNTGDNIIKLMVAYMMCVKDRVRGVAWEDTRNEIATYVKWDTLELLGYTWRVFV